MQLNQRQIDIIDILWEKHQDLANGDDNQRRELTRMIAEQICLEMGNRWGMKARNGGNIDNASKDSIAYFEDDGTCSIWDWQNGSTRKRQVNVGQGPTYPHSPQNEAWFIVVDGKDHIGQVPPDEDGDDGQPDDVMAKLTEILSAIDSQILPAFEDIRTQLMDLKEKVNQVQDKVNNFQFPSYEGRVLGAKVTLTPTPKK